MKITDTFSSALRALSLNKIRSFLTMLGVIIGVFAVVSLVSLVKGIENFVVDTFNSLGSNLVIVAPGRTGFDQDPSVSFTDNKLEIKHVETVREFAGNYIVGVSPNIRISKPISYKTKTFWTSLVGVNEEGINITNYEIAEGRFFSKNEVDSNSRVIVLGSMVEKELFGKTSGLGKNVSIDGISFEIIGTLKSKGSNSDERAIMPYTTVQETLGINIISGITAKAKDADLIDTTVSEVELAMLRELKKDEFTVLSQKEILDSISNILNILSIGLGAIAGISLLVGGIGIMNIMLVSVTERTREVGLRKALGATSTDIGLQFIIEAVFISLSGGIIGLLFGYLLTFGLRSFVNAQIPIWASLVGITFSLAVGVVFGTYPALKASKKDPIEALRFE